jgi:hypothetical protein
MTAFYAAFGQFGQIRTGDHIEIRDVYFGSKLHEKQSN